MDIKYLILWKSISIIIPFESYPSICWQIFNRFFNLISNFNHKLKHREGFSSNIWFYICHENPNRLVQNSRDFIWNPKIAFYFNGLKSENGKPNVMQLNGFIFQYSFRTLIYGTYFGNILTAIKKISFAINVASFR